MGLALPTEQVFSNKLVLKNINPPPLKWGFLFIFVFMYYDGESNI